MKARTLALVSVLVATSTIAHAQLVPVPKVRLRVGYGSSDSFQNRAGTRVRLQGPEIAADFLVASVLGFDFSASPSVVLGGALGGGPNGQVYRLLGTVRRRLSDDPGIYGTLGVGFAGASGSSFSGDNGAVLQFGLGFSLNRIPGPLRPILEINAFTGSSPQTRGVFVGLSGGF
jgi:hypothetical protein